MRFQHTPARIGILFLLVACATPAASVAPPTFTPEQLRADLASLSAALHDMPPDLAHTADPGKVEQALDVLSRQIGTASLDRDATWRLFATLNPVLGDGHLFVGFVDWRGDARAHLASGGVFFPFEVTVAPDGAIHIEGALGGHSSRFTGTRVDKINGIDAGAVTTALLSRVHGDTPAFRRALLSRRFWLYYWKVFGAPGQFDFTLAGGEPTRVSGSAALPAVLADEDSFENQFHLELLPDDAAVLTVSSFAWSDKAQFLAFTRHAFEKMRAAGTRILVIDVRANGGGNDEMWI